MNFKILNMQLLNFKGVRKLNVSFSDVTNITGDNATGKTTVFDAFTWLLFGKNSGDAKDFNIKTLDADNNPIHKLEHQVSATLLMDSRTITLKRIFKEKWVKKRGEETSEFTGHETLFFYDDVPLSQKEYQARVDIIISESIAKLVTNPLYFNQQKWQDRRQVLEAMAGTITNDEIAGDNENFKRLVATLGDASLIDYKKKIGAKKKIIKDQLEGIPTRIDEAKRSMPEEYDYADIRMKISKRQLEVQKIDTEIEDKGKALAAEFDTIKDKQHERHQLELKLKEVQNEGNQVKQDVIRDLESQLRMVLSGIKNDESEIESNNKLIANNTSRINKLEDDNKKLRAEWAIENSKTITIDPSSLSCPACLQALPVEKQEETKLQLTTNFNNTKASKLKSITDQGTKNAVEIDRIRASNEILEKECTDLFIQIGLSKKKLEDLYRDKTTAEESPAAVDKAKVQLLEKQIKDCVVPELPKVDNSELKSRKAVLVDEIDSLKQSLATEEQIERLKARVEELEKEESTLSQELADLERTEFTIDAFSKAKIETIEARINGKFKIVKFKMFEQQINGGETECCECMVDGVPYSDVNTAGKIQAGIDIINALTEHYGVNAPVWIDNRESVIRIPECKSQIINLRAVKDAKLTVKIEEREAVAV